MLKSKRSQEEGLGMMGSHTIETIIAVLSILILIFVGVAVYGLFKGSTMKKDQAIATADLLKAEIEALADGTQKNFTATSPQEWYVMVYNAGTDIPATCFLGPSCLCICDDDSLKSCNNLKTGACVPILEKKISISGNPIEIGTYTKLNLQQVNKEVTITFVKS